MTTAQPVRIGTRGSSLALTQTGLVQQDLSRLTGEAVELVRVRTEGDRLTGSLAALGGAGVFVTALREALLDGRCDVAVHSLKDLPTIPAEGLVIAAIPERADPRDALCARDGLTLEDLPAGSTIGTGSPRRAAQLLSVRPDCEVVDIRGNVDTRLRRIAGSVPADHRPGGRHAAAPPSEPGYAGVAVGVGSVGVGVGDGIGVVGVVDGVPGPLHGTQAGGDLDAVVLAAAGLTRLDRLDAVTDYLDPVLVAPAPGQGALAVECTAETFARGGPLVAALTAMDHLPTRLAVTAERAVLARLEAGCAAPIGALGHMNEDRLRLDVVVAAPNGLSQMRTSATIRLPGDRDGQLAAAEALGVRIADHLLDAGVRRLAPLGAAAGDGPEDVAPGARPLQPGALPALSGWRVLVPRGGDWGDKVVGLLREQGAEPVVVPLIEFGPPDELTMLDSALTGLALGIYDWITVTSGTTVPYLAARAPLHVAASSGDQPPPAVALAALLGNVQVAAVGPGTAAALERIGVTPDLVPAGERSARGLLAEFPGPPPQGHGPGLTARVLVPHSDLAEPTLADGLRDAGWHVDDVIAYRTLSGSFAGEELRDLVRTGGFDAVLLSSASTVTNLVELVGTPPPSTVICCIGPRTERAALELGLPVHVIPEAASAEALVEALARYAQEVPRP